MDTTDEGLTRREREKLAHRQEIIDAAERIFSKKGFSNATIDEIAQEAEFSKGALYIYFSSKEDILYSLLKEKSSMLRDNLIRSLSGKKDIKEELTDFFEISADFALKEKNFFSLMIELHSAKYKMISLEKSEEFMLLHEGFNEAIRNRVKQAVDDGELRNVEIEMVCGLIHGVSHNMAVTRWECDSLEALKKDVASFIDILFNGIAKEKEN